MASAFSFPFFLFVSMFLPFRRLKQDISLTCIQGEQIPNSVDLLEVGGHRVARSEHVKLSGVIIDEYSSWKPYLDAICTRFREVLVSYVG